MQAKMLALAGLVALLLAGGPAQALGSRSCDRACLEGFAGRYLDALAARDPARLKLAKTVRFIENDQPLALGEGTWATVDGVGTYRHLFADPQAGRVAAIAVVRENGVLAILDLVLAVENRRIAEVESQIVRDPKGAARYEALGAPEALWLQAVAPDQRIPREALVATADKYFQSMQRNDPKGDYSFFDKECDRLEHAEKTTNLATPKAYGHSNDTDFSSMGCQAQFQTGFLGFVTEIRDRRYVVVDEERQAVFAFADFDHNGTVRVLHMSTGKDFVVPAYFDVPRTLQVGEAFRMRGDKVHRIEMTLTELPYGMGPPAPAAPRPKPPPSRPPCDRECLTDAANAVLQAMMDHDPRHAPLAADVRYTENGQALKPGDGLWGTATAIAMAGDGLASLGRNPAYRLYVADIASGQVGYVGAINENGTPGMLVLRVKVVAGKVTDLEALVVREETVGPRGGTISLFAPQLLSPFDPKGFASVDPSLTTDDGGAPRAALLDAVNRYLEGMQAGAAAGSPLDPACVRRDNGRQTTGNAAAAPLDPGAPGFKPFALGCAAQLDSGLFRYLSKVRGRRVLAADEGRGLVLAVALVDHAGAATSIQTSAGAVALPANLITPSTDLTALLFKVRNGRIVRIETLARPVPFGMASGWD